MNSSKPHAFFIRYLSIAACLVLMVLASILLSKQMTTPAPTPYLSDTYHTPQQAYRETQKVLTYVSQKLNKGLDELKEGNRKIEKSEQIIQEQLNYK